MPFTKDHKIDKRYEIKNLFPWLTIELTNDCSKSCWFCGRNEIRKNGKMEIGYLDMKLFKNIISQYNGEIIQFSRDGDPLLSPNLSFVGALCRPFVTNIVTNGKLLWERRSELFDVFTSVTVSIIEDDIEQFEVIKKFREYSYPKLPIIYIKFLGDYYNPEFEKMGFKTMRRVIHNPQGDWDYQGHIPPVSEIGVCLDFLNKPSITWDGKFSICNRFDPQGLSFIGDVTKQSLKEIWESDIRQEMLHYNKIGRRDKIPFCKDCQYWGFPAT